MWIHPEAKYFKSIKQRIVESKKYKPIPQDMDFEKKDVKDFLSFELTGSDLI